jgi:hypothetical protein
VLEQRAAHDVAKLGLDPTWLHDDDIDLLLASHVRKHELGPFILFTRRAAT